MNYTKTQHSASYPSISPTLPALSAASKTVLITGASSGIGQATARAFLEAGCARLALVSRRLHLLSTLVSELRGQFLGSQILTFAADIQDSKALEAAFTGAKEKFKLGGREEGEEVSIDVVINCAGYAPTLAPLAGKGEADLADWWRGFEVNVLGAATLARVVVAASSHASVSPEAVVLQLGTAGALLPAQLPMSGYAVSKLALVKLMEYFGAENPGLRVVTVHPGIVPGTEGGQKMVKESGIEWPGDDIELPAHFLVWAASDEAKFLKNKFVFANWDVNEMKAREQEIAGSLELTIGLNGFPKNFE
ncbi:cellulase signal transduction associated dehydrogenase [Xylariaceae sp. AK1471]|nr:cellulase signal transduction associated dehydrogenase [Xylariaceae sp. AK1471]